MKIGILTDIHLRSPKSIELYYGSVVNEEVNSLFDRIKAFEDCIIDLDCEILILSGDISAADSLNDLDFVFKTIKSVRADLKVLVVKGNHDYWESKNHFISLDELIEEHNKIFKKYGITYLQDSCFKKDNLLIVGYDGWYHINPHDQTKDMTMIPRFNSKGADSFSFLKKIEYISLDRIFNELDKAEYNGKTKICVTHFNFDADVGYDNLKANPFHLSLLKEKSHIIIYGHNHKSEDRMIDGVRVINAGVSKQKNKFNFKIIELNI